MSLRPARGVRPTMVKGGISIPDDLSLKDLPKFLRQMQTQWARDLEAAQRNVLNDPRLGDTRIAHALRAMDSDMEYISTGNEKPGDVFYVVDRQHFSAAPGGGTGPGGTTPTAGAPHNLLDGVQDQDTVAGASARGYLIVGNGSTPSLWQRFAFTANSLLGSGATDPAWVAKVTTRSVWLFPVAWWTDAGASATFNDTGGSAPNKTMVWEFTSIGAEYIYTDFQVPYDYASGSLTLKVYWATNGTANKNWVPFVNYLGIPATVDFGSAGSTITGPTTSTAHATNVVVVTTVGTVSSVSAGEVFRLSFYRAPGGADDFTGTIRFLGLEVSYASSY